MILFDKTDTVIGNIQALKATIYQEINGRFTASVTIDNEDPLKSEFKADAIVEIKDANGLTQKFRLKKPVSDLYVTTADAWHISQDLANEIVLNRGWETQTGAQVWPQLLQAGITERRFTGTSDIATVASLKLVRANLLSSAINYEQYNSFVNRFGGEMERNNYSINMKARLGTDKDYRIQFRRNLVGLNIVEDSTTIVNRIIPTYLSPSDTAVTLPEIYIDSALIAQTPTPICQALHFSDIKVGAEVDGDIPYPSDTAAQTEVRARVAKLYAEGIDTINLNIEVVFTDLRRFDEYADYALLETLNLGDGVVLMHDDYTLRERMVAYAWDSLNNEYISITLGKVAPGLESMQNGIATQISNMVDEKVRDRYIVQLVQAIADMRSSVANANGYFTTDVYNADGSKSTYWHDAPTLALSSKIEYYPEPGSRVYTETGWNGGNPAWTTGTVNGSLVMNLITTIGLNAEIITVTGGYDLDTYVTQIRSDQISLAQTVSDLKAGNSNLLMNTEFGTSASPSDYWWIIQNGTTWNLVKARFDTWNELKNSGVTWNGLKTYNW